MSKSKYTDALCLGIIAFMLVLTILFCFGERLGLTAVEKSTELTAGRGKAVIELADARCRVKGTGVYEENGVVTVALGGEYTFTGECSEGQIVVETASGESVKLILSGLSLRCSTGAPLWVKNAGSVTVELAAGSQNTLATGEAFSLETVMAGVSGALYCEDDLTLQGEGSLTVESPAGHGIVSKDDLTVRGGSYVIDASGDGLRGRDSITVEKGDFTVTAGGDGFKSNNRLDAARGFIVLRGGSYVITAVHDGVQAETTLTVEGGDYTVTTGAGAQEREGSYIEEAGVLDWTGPSKESTSSAKGFKAGSALEIRDGSFILDCADDCLHSNGSLTIAGGSFRMSSGDDAVHAGGSLTVQAGRLNIPRCREGLEGKFLVFSGGEADITASKNGLNASGGADWARLYGTADTVAGEEALPSLTVSGGTLRICSEGDGLDSNGDLIITGGDITVSAAPAGNNSALDYGAENGGVCRLQGGRLAAAGFAAGVELDGAGQTVLFFPLSAAVSSGTAAVLLDASGEELLRFTPEQDYSAVLFSCQGIKKGERYTLAIGDVRHEITLA